MAGETRGGEQIRSAVELSKTPERKKEALTVNKERSEQLILETYGFQYGLAPKDHPAQKAAERAANLSRKPGSAKDVRVYVLPEWKEINAAAFGEQTIIVSPKLMSFCDTEEGLIGVLGHERLHLEAEDTLHSGVGQDVYGPAGEALATIGTDRLMEHRADLQGAVDKLDEAGVNPLGYKEFLSKLHHRFSKQYGHRNDLAHGSSQDRALSIGLLARYYDLSSTSEELHWISEVDKKAWTTFPRADIGLFSQSVRRVGAEPKFWNKRDLERRKAFTDLPDEGKLKTLQLMNCGFKETSVPAAKELDDEFLRSAWVESKTVLSKRFEEFEPSVGDSALKLAKYFLGSAKKMNAPKTREELQVTGTLLRSPLFQEQFPLPVSANPIYLMQSWTEAATIAGTFGDVNNETFSSEQWLADSEVLAEALTSFFDAKGLVQVEKQQLIAQAAKTLARTLRKAKKFKALVETSAFFESVDEELADLAQEFRLVDSESAARWEVERALSEDPVFQELQAKYGLKFETDGLSNPVELEALLLDIFERLGKDQSGGYFRQLQKILANTVSGDVFMRLAKETQIGRGGQKRLEREISTRDRALATAYVVAFDEVLVEGAFFKELNDLQRDCLRSIHLYQGSSIAGSSMFELIGAQEEEKHAAEKAYAKYIPQIATASEEEVKWFLSFMQRGEADYGVTMGYSEAQRLVARGVVGYLARQSVNGALKTIAAWRAEGLQIDRLLTENKSQAAPLLQLFTKSLETRLSRKVHEEILDYCRALTLDPFLQDRLESYKAESSWQTASSFEDKTGVVFSDDGVQRDLLERLIEEHMTTQDEVKVVRAKMRQAADLLFERKADKIGTWAVADMLKAGQRRPLETLSLLLGTGTSDLELRQVLWDEAEVTEGLVKGYEDRNDEELTPDDVNVVKNRVALVDVGISGILSLSQTEKSLIVKKLLVDSGLIQNPRLRQDMFTQLLDNRLTEGDPEVAKWITATADGLAKVNNWELLFFALAPELTKAIANPPATPGQWSDVDGVKEMVGYDDAKQFTHTKLRTLPMDAGQETWKYEERYSLLASDDIRKFLTTKGVLDAERRGDKIKPMDFVVETSQNLGALAIRFLQLLPQFVDIRKEYQAAFNRLYDGVEGQSKLAAVTVVERERPDVWEHIEEFGNKIGGGSLMTVYKLTMKDGTKRAARVRNPNVEYHLALATDIVRQTIEGMVTTRSINEAEGDRLTSVVGHVEDWIQQDLSFSGFLERDQRFRQVHEGFSYGGYSVRVPKSEAPENDRIQIEEYIEGKNLTQWDELVADGNDMKAVVALLAKDFVLQLQAGLVHSDCHPGNFRVTSEKQLAILDRTFMFELEPTEQMLVAGMVTGTADSQSLESYFLGLATDGSKDSVKTAVHKSANVLVKAFQKGAVIEASQELHRLRQVGVELPLKLTLLLRNFDSLQQFAKKAGFADLKAAILA